MIYVENRGNEKYFLVNGDLDHDTLQDFNSVVDEALSLRDNTDFVIDLDRTRFIDSACLGVISRVNRELSNRGNKVKLINVSGGVASTLYVTSLEKILEIEKKAK